MQFYECNKEDIISCLTDKWNVKVDFFTIFDEDNGITFCSVDDKVNFYNDTFTIIRKNGARRIYNYNDVDSIVGLEIEDLPFEEKLKYCPKQ